jgi:serine/threonine protein phosphatase 1
MVCLVVGDIHGCSDELHALVAQARLSAGDEVIALGDLFDRGPDPAGVLRFFKERPRARSVLGNHERKHLLIRNGAVAPAISQIVTRELLGRIYDEAVSFMARLPLVIELSEAIIVHGFWRPGLPLERQEERVLVGTLGAEAALVARFGARWYEHYDGPKPLVVGHHDYLHDGRPLVYRDRVFGLDTGCCHGGALTGLLLPSFRLISVPSRGNHWGRLRQRFAREREQARRTTDLELNEDVLAGIARSIEDASRRVLSRLRARGAYDELPQREQARLFALIVGDGPFAALMHRARTGNLNVRGLRGVLRSRERLQSVLRRLREAGSGDIAEHATLE